jgi:hypothetical protein
MREEYYKKVVCIAFYIENTTILKKLNLQLIVLAMLLELVKKLSTNFNQRQQQYILIR